MNTSLPSLTSVSGKATNLNMTQRDETWTTQQAADHLGVHEETFRRWVRLGKIQRLRMPIKPWRFRADDVRALSTHEDGAA